MVERYYTRDTSVIGHGSTPDGLGVCDRDCDWHCDWVWEGDWDWPSWHRDGVRE